MTEGRRLAHDTIAQESGSRVQFVQALDASIYYMKRTHQHNQLARTLLRIIKASSRNYLELYSADSILTMQWIQISVIIGRVRTPIDLHLALAAMLEGSAGRTSITCSSKRRVGTNKTQ